MVVKKFRRFVMALCISMSAVLCASAIAPAAFASETGQEVETGEDCIEMEAPWVEPVGENNAASEEGASGDDAQGTEDGAGEEEEEAPGQDPEDGTADGEEDQEPEDSPGDGTGDIEINGPGEPQEPEDHPGQGSGEGSGEGETEENRVSISQDVENPKSTDKVTVSIKLEAAEDQEEAAPVNITLDGQTKVSGFYSEGLDGAKIRLTYEGGEQILTMKKDLSLSPYMGITDISIMPETPLEKGTTELSMKIQAEKEMTGQIHIGVKTDLDNEEVEAEKDIALLYCAVEKPVIGHPGSLVQFGKELTVKMEGISIHANHDIKDVVYTMQVPNFMTLKSIRAPKLSSGTIDVYTVDGENSTLLGENAGGTVLDPQGTPSMVMFVIHPENNAVEESAAGSIVLVNDQKKNKTNYYGCQASLKAECVDGTVVEKGSSVVGVTLQVYKYTEPEPPQAGDKPEGGGNSGGGNTGDPGNTQETEPPQEPEPEPETEDPNKAKEEEAQRRRAEAAAALRKQEEEEKSEQRSLLLSRLNSIKTGVSSTGTGSGEPGAAASGTGSTSGASGTTGTAGTAGTAAAAKTLRTIQGAAAKKLYEDKKIAAIDESMVLDLKEPDVRLATQEARDLFEKNGVIAIKEDIVSEKNI